MFHFSSQATPDGSFLFVLLEMFHAFVGTLCPLLSMLFSHLIINFGGSSSSEHKALPLEMPLSIPLGGDSIMELTLAYPWAARSGPVFALLLAMASCVYFVLRERESS